MSKPVKELIRREMKKRFEGVTSLAVVGFSGLDGVATNQIRGRLLKQNVQVTVVKNSLARQAFKDQSRDLLRAPVELVPKTMQNVRCEQVWDGRFYGLSFVKPVDGTVHPGIPEPEMEKGRST